MDQPPTGLRLGTDVVPRRYTLDLSIDPGTTEIDGDVAIVLELRRPTSVVWLNGRNLDVDKASVVFDTRTVSAVTLRDAAGSRIGFHLERPVGPGAAILRIRYRAAMAADGELGVFRRKLGASTYVFTSLEPLSAREVFPCFDEPSFKTPWQINLRVPAGLVALSNMPVQRTERDGRQAVVHFAESPPLPSYLVAFAVGPFEVLDVGKSAGGAPVRIVVPSGHAAEARWSQTAILPILAELEGYFGTRYPFAKLDLVAVPGVRRSMENPGLVTCSGPILLTGDSEARRRQGAVIVAHELSHMWFGDLVTPSWWDDVWLNESFATWMSARTVGAWRPAWPADVAAVSLHVLAWGADAVAGGRAVRQPIGSEVDIQAAFDTVTYEKGAAVLGMIEGWIGPDTFQTGIRAYIDAHANGSVNATDLLAALGAEARKDVRGVVASFVTQSGAPRLRTELFCEPGRPPRVALAQERYLAIGEAAGKRRWSIPVCLHVAGSPREICTILDGDRADVELASCPAWVYPNAGGRGYYVSAPGPDLRAALVAHVGELGRAERLHFLADLVAEAEVGDVPVEEVLAALPSFAPATDLGLAQRTLAFLYVVAELVLDDSTGAFARYSRSLFAARMRELGTAERPGESSDDVLLRPILFDWLATEGGDVQLSAEAVRLARLWLDGKGGVSASMVPAALHAAGWTGDRALLDRLRGSLGHLDDPEQRLWVLGGLAAVRSSDLVEDVFDFALESSLDVRDAAQLMSILSIRPTSRRQYLELARGNVDAMNRRFRSGWQLPSCCDEDGFKAFSSFVSAFSSTGAAGNKQLERAARCIAFRHAEKAGAVRFFAGK